MENATFIKYGGKYDIYAGDVGVEANYGYVDTTFFDVFSFPVVAGDPSLLKKDPQMSCSQRRLRRSCSVKHRL